MQRWFFGILVLMAAASTATAGPLVYVNFTSGQLDFGTDGALQYGHPAYAFRVHYPDGSTLRVDVEQYEAWWYGESGPLIRQELVRDSAGVVTLSRYLYSTGLMTLEVYGPHGEYGQFTAPLSMALTVHEGATPSIEVTTYALGPGMFTPWLADFLGVRRRTAGGGIDVDLLRPTGDYTSRSRNSHDAAHFTIDVPEPHITSLILLALAMAWARRVLSPRHS